MDPPQPSRKTVFLNLGLFQFLSFVRRGMFYTFMITYLYDLMGNVTLTAMLGTLDMVASALGQNLLWGRISDRWRLRGKLIVAGESIAAVAYLGVFSVHRSLINAQADFAAGLSLIIGLSFLEFFWSMSDVGWASLLTDLTTTKTRGRIVGTLNFIASFGRMIGINIAGFLYMDGEGFRQGTLFYIVVAMLLTSALLMWSTSRSGETPVPRQQQVIRSEEEKTSDDNVRTYRWFLASLIIVVIGASCVNQVFLLFPRIARSDGGLGASDPEVGLILTAWTLGGMLTSLSCGWLADRFGRIRVLLTGLLIAIATPLAYGFAPNVPSLALVYGLNGVSFWTVQTVGFAFAGDVIPEDRRGRLFSRYNAVMALGWGPAGLLVGGPLADAQTRIGLSPRAAYVNTFYASSAIVALGMVVFVARVARAKSETPKL